MGDWEEGGDAGERKGWERREGYEPMTSRSHIAGKSRGFKVGDLAGVRDKIRALEG
jgi:hypothetical protein